MPNLLLNFYEFGDAPISMALTFLNSRWLVLALPLIGAMAGCCCEAFPLPGESTSCPTDARRIYCGAGEEAVRRCPCGPGSEFYGHKATDWRTWPEGWRCGQYPCDAQSIEQPMPSETIVAPTNVTPPHVDNNAPNPFRSQPVENAAEELPTSVVPPTSIPTTKPLSEIETPKAATPPVVPPQATPPQVTPPQNTEPVVPIERPAATPLDPNPLYLPPALKKSAKNIDEEDTSFISDEISDEGPVLIAAQNGAPAIDKPTSDPSVQQASKTVTEPAVVPALEWGGKAKVQTPEVKKDESPLSKRVTQHLTHSLLD